MTLVRRCAIVVPFVLAMSAGGLAQEMPRPVTPDPSTEASRLLAFLHSISGRHTLTGQHCVPLVGSGCLPAMQKQTHVDRRGFAREDYDALLALAAGKPIALGEVGPIPPVDLRRSQPRWTWFMGWTQPASLWREGPTFLDTYQSEEALTHDELPWVEVKTPTVHYPVLR